MAKVNTEAPAQSAPTMATAESRRSKLLTYYRNCPVVKRSISPLYAPYLGKVIQISINGITIAMPVDGSQHEVPEPFGDEIDSRIMAIDATIHKSQKMSNVAANAEMYPGALQMF